MVNPLENRQALNTFPRKRKSQENIEKERCGKRPVNVCERQKERRMFLMILPFWFFVFVFLIFPLHGWIYTFAQIIRLH